MKKQIIDSTDSIIYEGHDAKPVYDVLIKNFREVTEEDEVKYSNQLYNLKWIGELRFEVLFEIKFRGIDFWNRPVFKDIASTSHFGSTNKLFDYNAKAKEVTEYFKDNLHELEYFGHDFDCEPNGGISEYWKFKIINN